MAISIVVETGSGDNPAANSYTDLDYVKAYAAERGIDLGNDDEVIKAWMINSMDYFLSYSEKWKGDPTQPGVQPLDWARVGVWIETYEVPDTEIPKLLKKAQAQLVVEQKNGAVLLPSVEPGLPVIREKVDVIETEYANPASTGGLDWTQPHFPLVDALLSKLLNEDGFSLRSVRI